MIKSNKIIFIIVVVCLMALTGYYLYLHYFSGKNEISEHNGNNISGSVVEITDDNIKITTGTDQESVLLNSNTSFLAIKTSGEPNQKISKNDIFIGNLVTVYFDNKDNQKLAIIVYKLQ